MPYERELRVALEAARRAEVLILDHYSRFEAIANPRMDISTAADRDAQEAILQHLRAAFPADALCAEESMAALEGVARVGPRLWIVDPIDGTRGFASKNGEFAVMVGFVHEGRVAVGVVAQPAAGKLTYAVMGGGCWRQDDGAKTPSACRVSATPTLAEATLTRSHTKTGKVGPEVTLGVPRVIESYSAGLKLALVARGDADLYVNTYVEFHDWDIAAGHLLVEEAGGRVTGLGGQTLCYGEPGAWQRHGLLGSNGLVHDAALTGMKR